MLDVSMTGVTRQSAWNPSTPPRIQTLVNPPTDVPSREAAWGSGQETPLNPEPSLRQP